MSERSVRCPACPFEFTKLVDAGDFHAYVCPSCGWSKATDDRRPGNRPADVCALCDRPLDPRTGRGGHLYFGRGWVHGGGREHIPIHNRCADACRDFERNGMDDDCTCAPMLVNVVGYHKPWCMEAVA